MTACTRSAIRSTRITAFISLKSSPFFPPLFALLTYCKFREVDDFARPHSNALDMFNQWLHAHSIDSESVTLSSAQDWATFTVPVSQAEVMLNSEFHIYHHQTSGRRVIRTLEYSLPGLLTEYIDTIQPTTYFGSGTSEYVSI